MKKIMMILGIAFLSLIVLLVIFIPIKPMDRTSGNARGHPLIIGHRGASGNAPENTLPAIDSALAAGADYIEIDVQLSKDNFLIVMHDETVDRTTNGKGKISDLTAAEILSLDAGSWFGKAFAGTKVPLLEDVVSHVNGRAKLLIEIKKKNHQYIGIEELTIGVIRKHNSEKWCVVQSFNDEVLEILHDKAPDIELHKLIFFKFRIIPYAFDGKITRFDMVKYDYIKSVNMNYLFFNKSFLQGMHDHGKKIFLWGCRKKIPCFSLGIIGCDGVISDFPKDYISCLNNIKPD
jgi:glycerophosphoryl diester phosphodiesterase